MASLAGTPPNLAPSPVQSHRRSALAEWPTWLVWGGVYGGFFALTAFWSQISPWIAIPALAYLVCWNGHLMHEVLHGHPTRNKTINRLLILPNLFGWMPYEIYRDSHIAHHETDHLSHPTLDPESYYIAPEQWARTPGFMQAVLRANNSLIGRMLIGPILMVSRFWISEIRRYASGDSRYIGAWIILIINNLALAYWLFDFCALPVWQVAFGLYGGLSLGLVRSFTEHRPADNQDARCAIVESGPLMQLLFLNNNFHIVHHTHPSLSWYEIPGTYYRNRDYWIAKTQGHWFSTYWDVLRRCAFTAKDSPRFSDQA